MKNVIIERATPALIVITLFILVWIALSIPGCTSSQEPEGTPAPLQESPPASTSESVLVPAPTTTTEPAPEIAPSVSAGSIAKFDISKAPKVGEIVDLTFTLDINGPLKPVNKVWLEFECYDPAIYYPLGRGRGIDRGLEMLSKIDPTHSEYSYFSQAAREQPESLVPPETVLVTGNSIWQGEPLKRGDQVQFSDTVCFPEQGEWYISARWQIEGEKVYTRSELYLTVAEDSGMIGWPRDYSRESHQTNTQERPVSIFIKTGRAPIVGEPLPLTISIESIKDLAQAEVSLEFGKRGHYGVVIMSVHGVIVTGESTWQGSLKKGVPVEFSCVVKFSEEGDWQISSFTRASSESYGISMCNRYLHVGREKSRFGWTEPR